MPSRICVPNAECTATEALRSPAPRARLASTGTVVYLQASIDTQLLRTKPGRNRPLLMNDDPRAVLERLMSIRQPLYEEIADVRVDTTGRRVRAVATSVRDLLDAPP